MEKVHFKNVSIREWFSDAFAAILAIPAVQVQHSAAEIDGQQQMVGVRFVCVGKLCNLSHKASSLVLFLAQQTR